MDTLNWTQVKEVAHSLKSSSGYVGASRIHYDCYFMQEAYNIKELPKVGQRYNRLVENSIEFMIYAQ